MISRSASSLTRSWFARVEPCFLALLRQKVALRYLKLLLIGVACKLYDLHTVERALGMVSSVFAVVMKNTSDRSKGISRKLSRNVEFCSPSSAASSCRRRVAPIVGAKLVYFVKHHERVALLA